MRDKREGYGKYLKALLTLGDFAVLNLSYMLTILLINHNAPFDSTEMWFLINLSFVPSAYLYSDIHSSRIVYADRVVLTAMKSVCVFTLILTFCLYAKFIHHIGIQTDVSFICIFAILLCLWWLSSRQIIKRVRRMGFNFRRVIIVGSTDTSKKLFHQLQGDEGYGFRLMGVFDRQAPDSKEFGGAYAGTLADINDFLRLNKIDLIFYASDGEDYNELYSLLNMADEVSAEFTLVPKSNPMLSGLFKPSRLGDMSVLTHTFSPLHYAGNRFVKRIFDLAVSGTFLLVSPLIFIPIAIAVKLSSPGPIFFRQKRTGIRGEDFVCYKFRTMRVNADADKLQATKDDPRKTRVGNFLRRTSLDELPQFYNVFKGNMSIVGPRPHMVSQTEEYSRLIDKYMVRHAVKPGITGWAQVNGYRGETKHLWQMERRVEYDVWYVRNWNLILDLKIFVLTMFNGLRGEKNAY